MTPKHGPSDELVGYRARHRWRCLATNRYRGVADDSFEGPLSAVPIAVT